MAITDGSLMAGLNRANRGILTHMLTAKRNTDKYFKNPRTINEIGLILDQTKHAHNVGMTLRIAGCFCISDVVVTGPRILREVEELNRIPREERHRFYADVHLSHTNDPLKLLAPDVVPVAVEYRPNSEMIYDFEHPEKAVYIFGPEDRNVSPEFLSRCHRFLKVDTAQCLNLAVAVGI